MRAAVADKASALLQSVKRTSFQTAELLYVAMAWSDMDNGSYQGKTRAPRPSPVPTLVLVSALLVAHEATMDPVL